MKKRLQKKLHLKEYSEYGIEFEIKIISQINEKKFDELFYNFINDFVEGNGFYCGGCWNAEEKRCSMIVEVGRDLKKTIEYIPKLKKWFEYNKIDFQLSSSLCNLWYPERKINISSDET